MITLPKSKRLQNYKVSVKISSKLSMLSEISSVHGIPRNIISIVSSRNSVVSVKYVDYTIERNFIDTIDSWFSVLSVAKVSKYELLLQKFSYFIPPVSRYLMMLFSGFLIFYYSANIISEISKNLNLLYLSLIGSFGFILLTGAFARYFGRVSEINIDNISDLSCLLFNKGDSKLLNEYKYKNKMAKLKVVFSVITNVGLGILSSIIASNVIQ